MNRFQKILYWYFSRKSLPYWCVLLVDSVMLFVSGLAVYWLFHGGTATLASLGAVATAMLIYVALGWVGMRVFHTYSGIIRYASFVDLRRVFFANMVALSLAFVVHYVAYLLPETAVAHLSMRELLVTYLLSTALMSAVRVLMKTLYEVTTSDGSTARRCLIYGTMTGGVALAKSMRMQQPSRFVLKGFITHEYRNYKMPDILENTDSSFQQKWTEHNVSIGGQLNKTQGKTLHFNTQAEYWLAGEDAGQLKLDFSTDLNFKLLGDTVRLAAKAQFRRLNPTFYQRRYHSKFLWWDNQDNLSKETRTRIEGIFSYEKTDTKLRVAIEEVQNYTYYGMSYGLTTNTEGAVNGRKEMTAGVYQESGNINILTAQLHQNFRLGPLNWENVVTYQNCSNTDVLPLPQLNIFSNLYLKFKIARVLGVELGTDATYFTKYNAPDFCPLINQFAVQQNAESKVELGEYPFVDVYANLVLKGCRFFFVMTNVLNGSGNHKKFLTPHYPTNGMVLHMGVSWPFFN
jgi:hypothetical protein